MNQPPLQGYRLIEGEYVPIEPVNGRLPSEELGLYLEQEGTELRLWNPQTGSWIPTLDEAREQTEQARKREEQARKREEQARKRAEKEVERLRKDLEALRRKSGSK